MLGAFLLLGLDPSVFEAVVPWLILFTCLLVGAQPWITRWLKRHHDAAHPPEPRETMSPATTFFAALTGVYGGYFGAGSGVMMVAVLGLGLDIELRIVNALKTLAVLSGNVVAGLIFVFVADLDWAAIVLLALGRWSAGTSARASGRRLPPTLFRVLIVIAGITAAALLF